MPSLASMRSVDPAGDSMQPLGPPIRETQHTPVPLPKPTGTPGVVQLPDGKLATNLPLPPQLAPYEWELDAAVAGGITTGRFRSSELNLSNKPKPANSFELFRVLHEALALAVKDENYPVTGRAWMTHILGEARPDGAAWVVLRNGEVREARGIYSWDAGSEEGPGHTPAFDVVGWK